MSIELANIRAGYDRFQLQGVSATIKTGSLTALIGPNGCGKSTLFKAISRQLPLNGGQVCIAGRDISGQRTRAVAQQVSMLPQHPVVPPGISVEQLVGYGRAPHQNLLGIRTAEDVKQIERALEIVGLESLRQHPVFSLSGGQRQRAFIAMCIAQDTPYVLFDEPTSFLDIKHQYEVLELMEELNRAGKTVVAVLHDIAQAARFASELMVMKDGALVAQGGPDEVVTETMVRDVYDLSARVYPDPVSGSAVVSPHPQKSIPH